MYLNIQLNMKKAYNDIFNVNPNYSTTIAYIIGLLLIDDLSVTEQNTLGNWIMLIAQTIVTHAASQNIIEARIKGGGININSKKVKSIYNPSYYKIEKAKEIIDKAFPNHSFEIDTIINAINELNDKVNELKKED